LSDKILQKQTEEDFLSWIRDEAKKLRQID
jgi:hypothetical protein